MTALFSLIIIGSAIVILASFLPLIPTHAGIVRICDFPRLQILIGGLAGLVGLVLVRDWQSWTFWVVAPLLCLAIALQTARILPYVPFAKKESRAAETRGHGTEFSLLIANVQQKNRNSGKLSQLVEQYDPDLVFLVEVDRWWEKQLQRIADGYPHVTSLPQDNGYGILFMSRLPVESCLVRRLVKPEIPSLKVRLGLQCGHSFWFYGLHPEPPGPVQDAEERDTELLLVATEVRDEGQPAVVAGDLNDVAWSRTTARFQRVSNCLDPRRGRGLYATFHADHWFARWPLDHLFHTKDFATIQLAVLAHIGSDHFPVFVRLSFAEARDTHSRSEKISNPT